MSEQLNTEIEEAARRIQNRQIEIEIEIEILEKKISRYTYSAWGFVWLGFAISIFAIILFSRQNNQNNGFTLNLLGDFMAGSVASTWSLAGLFFIYVAFLAQKQQLLNQQLEIMFNQLEVKYTRLELSGQREEMAQTRKEFLINRTTNIIYNQLERFERGVSELKILIEGKEYIGYGAIQILQENRKILPRQKDNESNEEYKTRYIEFSIENGHIYFINELEIEKFAQNTYNSIEVIKRQLFRSTLDSFELNDLKDLFFDNVGFVIMGILHDISELAGTISELTPNDHSKYKIRIGTLVMTNIYLDGINEFYRTLITEVNFDSEKQKWLSTQSLNYQNNFGNSNQ